jgi:hypothetical protein
MKETDVTGRVVTMLEDLAEIVEQGTKDHAPVRGFVGAGPVRFTEEGLGSYLARSCAGREHQRPTHSMDLAERAEA